MGFVLYLNRWEDFHRLEWKRQRRACARSQGESIEDLPSSQACVGVWRETRLAGGSRGLRSQKGLGFLLGAVGSCWQLPVEHRQEAVMQVCSEIWQWEVGMWPFRGSCLLWPRPTAGWPLSRGHLEDRLQPWKLQVLAQAEREAPSRLVARVQRREYPDFVFFRLDAGEVWSSRKHWGSWDGRGWRAWAGEMERKCTLRYGKEESLHLNQGTVSAPCLLQTQAHFWLWKILFKEVQMKLSFKCCKNSVKLRTRLPGHSIHHNWFFDSVIRKRGKWL